MDQFSAAVSLSKEFWSDVARAGSNQPSALDLFDGVGLPACAARDGEQQEGVVLGQVKRGAEGGQGEVDVRRLSGGPFDGLAQSVEARRQKDSAQDRLGPGIPRRIERVTDAGDGAALALSSEVLPGRLAFAEAVETAALHILKARKPDRSLQTHVEFYTALLLEALAFPPEAFTSVFAMGRTAGWIAHAREQQATGRLIRPQSRYVGPRPKATA